MTNCVYQQKSDDGSRDVINEQVSAVCGNEKGYRDLFREEVGKLSMNNCVHRQSESR